MNKDSHLALTFQKEYTILHVSSSSQLPAELVRTKFGEREEGSVNFGFRELLRCEIWCGAQKTAKSSQTGQQAAFAHLCGPPLLSSSSSFLHANFQRTEGQVPPHSHGMQWGVVISGLMHLNIAGEEKLCHPGIFLFLIFFLSL